MNISVSARLQEMGYELEILSEAMTATIDSAVSSIAIGAQNHWVGLAQDRLKTSRDTYINGLRQSESYSIKGSAGLQTFEIALVGQMANNFEFGVPSFDMKTVRPGWLGGAKAKRAKDGHSYVIIPMRHSTSSDARMAYSGKAAAVGNLKDQLKSAVRQYGLDRMIKTGTGQVVEGPVTRIPKSAPVHPYLKGLTRVQKSNAGRGSSQLVTWRVMSEDSPASSWIHPGIKGANLLPEVETWINNRLDEVIETILA